MAYKFQVGEATLSGSTKFEQQLDAAGGIKLSGISDTAVAVASDSILFYDSDGSMKRDTIADFTSGIANASAGLAAQSGQIGVNSGDGLKINGSNELVVEPADFAGTGLEDDGSDNLRIAAAAAGLGLSGGGGSALALDFSELTDEAIASGDRFAFRDATDDGMHADTVDDLASLFAGDGLAASSAVMSLDIANLSTDMTGDVADGDHFAIDDGGTLKKVDFSVVRDAVFADVSGDATVAAGGALTIAADSVEGTMLNTNAADGSTMELSSDSLSVLKVPNALSQGEGIAAFSFDGSGTATVALSASVGGEGLAYGSGVLKLDMNELTAAAVSVANDSIAIIDADDSNASKKESIADLMTAVAGSGLAASSGVLSVGVDDTGIEIDSDALRLKDSGVVTAKIADAAVTAAKIATAVAGDGLSGGGGSALALDLNELTAATVAVGADSIAIIDADDNSSKKESIADLMTAVAGTGLTAASGVLNAALDVALKADGDTLAAGMNYMADMSSDGEDVLTLPASPSVGDVVHVKAPSDCSQARTVRIDRAGSQTIDGLNSVTIESPFGAVSMVYVASNLWRLI